MMAEWVDVNERLPKKDGKYIVHTKNLTGHSPLDENIFVAEFIFNDFVFESWEDNDVTHWQPLPDSPKGETIKSNDETKLHVDICEGCRYFDGICVRMERECLRKDRVENG